MDSLVLELTNRKDQKANGIRTSGMIPAIYYGKGQPTKMLQVEYQKFKKMFDKAGENTIIQLELDGKTHPVLVHDVQYHPVSDRIIHIDFIHIDMNKEVTTAVKIVTVGIAPAVKNMAGVLDVLKHEIKIKCLPKDLIHEIEVDVSSIIDFNTTIHIKDLKVPSTIKLLDNPEDAVVTVTPPRAEEVSTPSPSDAAAAGATPAEGTAPAAGAPTAEAAPAKDKK